MLPANTAIRGGSGGTSEFVEALEKWTYRWFANFVEKKGL